jgi:WD40 repeat protein
MEDASEFSLGDVATFGDDLTPTVKSVAFTPNGQNLASGGQDSSIFLWDTRKLL